MSCNCLKSNNITNCPETLYVGTITDINTDVYAYIKNITTGRLLQFGATSDGYGKVVINTGSVIFNQRHLYEVSVTLQDVNNAENNLLITLDGFETCCIYFKVNNIWSGSTRIAGSAQSLSAENCASANTPSQSRVTYHQTAIDYSIPANIEVVGVTDTTNVVHIYLGNPSIYLKGQTITVKDESGNASVNNIIIHGAFDIGDPQIIAADLGGISFYSNGTDKFFIISDI
jgi:hypothetical protein